MCTVCIILTHLLCQECKLWTVLYRLVSLIELDVSSNSLEELPIGVGLLRHLRTLYADDNFLTYLPAEVTLLIIVVNFR